MNRIERSKAEEVKGRRFGLRNPFVPENFFTYYGTFLDEVHGKPTLDAKLPKKEKKAILLLEQVIKEVGWESFFDQEYIHDMSRLADQKDRPNEELQKTLEESPKELMKTRQELNSTLQQIDSNKHDLEQVQTKQKKSDIFHYSYMRRVGLVERKQEKIKIIKKIAELKTEIQESINSLKQSELSKSVHEKLMNRFATLDSLDISRLLEDKLIEIYLDFDNLATTTNTLYYRADNERSVEECIEKTAILESLLEEKASYINPKDYHKMNKDELLYEIAELENHLFIYFYQYPPEAAENERVRLLAECKPVENMQTCLEKERNKFSQNIKSLEEMIFMTGETYNARKKYGENWRDVLHKFQETEKDIYTEWGKRMIGYGLDDKYLEFGRAQDYF